MGQVNVTISGKLYRMACDDGQEAHLTELAERLGATVEDLRQRFGEIGDQRLTVMAAITMADQYSETETRLAALEAEIARLNDARRADAAMQGELETGVADALEQLAVRIEEAAERLAQPLISGEGG
jgi:cell division protein ZapA